MNHPRGRGATNSSRVSIKRGNIGTSREKTSKLMEKSFQQDNDEDIWHQKMGIDSSSPVGLLDSGFVMEKLTHKLKHNKDPSLQNSVSFFEATKSNLDMEKSKTNVNFAPFSLKDQMRKSCGEIERPVNPKQKSKVDPQLFKDDLLLFENMTDKSLKKPNEQNDRGINISIYNNSKSVVVFPPTPPTIFRNIRRPRPILFSDNQKASEVIDEELLDMNISATKVNQTRAAPLNNTSVFQSDVSNKSEISKNDYPQSSTWIDPSSKKSQQQKMHLSERDFIIPMNRTQNPRNIFPSPSSKTVSIKRKVSSRSLSPTTTTSSTNKQGKNDTKIDEEILEMNLTMIGQSLVNQTKAAPLNNTSVFQSDVSSKSEISKNDYPQSSTWIDPSSKKSQQQKMHLSERDFIIPTNKSQNPRNIFPSPASKIVPIKRKVSSRSQSPRTTTSSIEKQGKKDIKIDDEILDMNLTVIGQSFVNQTKSIQAFQSDVSNKSSFSKIIYPQSSTWIDPSSRKMQQQKMHLSERDFIIPMNRTQNPRNIFPSPSSINKPKKKDRKRDVEILDKSLTVMEQSSSNQSKDAPSKSIPVFQSDISKNIYPQSSTWIDSSSSRKQIQPPMFKMAPTKQQANNLSDNTGFEMTKTQRKFFPSPSSSSIVQNKSKVVSNSPSLFSNLSINKRKEKKAKTNLSPTMELEEIEDSSLEYEDSSIVDEDTLDHISDMQQVRYMKSAKKIIPKRLEFQPKSNKNLNDTTMNGYKIDTFCVPNNATVEFVDVGEFTIAMNLASQEVLRENSLSVKRRKTRRQVRIKAANEAADKSFTFIKPVALKAKRRIIDDSL